MHFNSPSELQKQAKRFIILHKSLKFRPRFLKKWLPLSILCNFSQHNAVAFRQRHTQKMYEIKLRSIFIDFLANFHCQFHSSGFWSSVLFLLHSHYFHLHCNYTHDVFFSFFFCCNVLWWVARRMYKKVLLNCNRSAKWERRRKYERIFFIACRLNSMIHERASSRDSQTHHSSLPLFYEIFIFWREKKKI